MYFLRTFFVNFKPALFACFLASLALSFHCYALGSDSEDEEPQAKAAPLAPDPDSAFDPASDSLPASLSEAVPPCAPKKPSRSHVQPVCGARPRKVPMPAKAPLSLEHITFDHHLSAGDRECIDPNTGHPTIGQDTRLGRLFSDANAVQSLHIFYQQLNDYWIDGHRRFFKGFTNLEHLCLEGSACYIPPLPKPEKLITLVKRGEAGATETPQDLRKFKNLRSLKVSGGALKFFAGYRTYNAVTVWLDNIYPRRTAERTHFFAGTEPKDEPGVYCGLSSLTYLEALIVTEDLKGCKNIVRQPFATCKVREEIRTPFREIIKNNPDLQVLKLEYLPSQVEVQRRHKRENCLQDVIKVVQNLPSLRVLELPNLSCVNVGNRDMCDLSMLPLETLEVFRMYNPPLDAVFWGPFQEALSLRELTFNFQTQGYAVQTHQSLEPLQKIVDFLRVNGNLQMVTVVVPEGWKTAAGANLAPLLNLTKRSKDI